MAKLKKVWSGKFTMISNEIFEDWRLSYKEKKPVLTVSYYGGVISLEEEKAIRYPAGEESRIEHEDEPAKIEYYEK